MKFPKNQKHMLWYMPTEKLKKKDYQIIKSGKKMNSKFQKTILLLIEHISLFKLGLYQLSTSI